MTEQNRIIFFWTETSSERSCINMIVVPYDQSFKLIAIEINKSVTTGLQMENLRKQFVMHLSESGIQAPNYQSQKLKYTNIKHQLLLWHPGPRSEAELVFFADVLTGQIVEAGAHLTPDTLPFSDDEYKEAPTDSVNISELYHTAKCLRMELKKGKGPN